MAKAKLGKHWQLIHRLTRKLMISTDKRQTGAGLSHVSKKKKRELQYNIQKIEVNKQTNK